MAAIDYYLFGASPFAYIGHKLFHEIAARHGLEINYRLIDLMAVWANSGSVPVGQRSPLRQRYRRIELQRLAAYRGLPLNVDPKHFPVDARLSDLCAIAIVHSGGNPRDYLWQGHRCVWAEGGDLGDPETIWRMLANAGHDADRILALARTDEIAAIRERNTADAIAADAVGAPVYVYKGEPFWGQDRLEQLEQMIVSGREPYTA